jgi:hypothetical protein
VVGDVVIELRQIRVSFAGKVERQADRNPGQWRMDGIESVGMVIEQLDGGSDVTYFIECLRGLGVRGDDADDTDQGEQDGKDHGPS